MVTSGNLIKIIDFGMAKKVINSAYVPQLDSNSSVVGTLAYMVCVKI